MRNAAIRLTEQSISDKANEIVTILKGHSKESPCSKKELMDRTLLTPGQISRVIKYMRRCCEIDFSTFIRYYPISSKRGYYLPKSWEDFLPCYITLSCWAESIIRTIQPMKDQLRNAGYGELEIEGIKEAYKDDGFYNYLENIPEINNYSSWFFDEDE